LILSVSSRALAQSASPRSNEWLTAGEVAFAQGRFGDALDAFELHYRKGQQPQTLRRIGDAADKLGNHMRASEALQAYLKHVPDAPDRDYIASRIDANQAALRPTLPRALSVVVAPVTVASDQQHGHNAPEATPPRLAVTQPEPSKPESESTHTGPAGPIWIWATGGAVVVAGIVIAAVLISSGGSSRMGDPVQGNVGSAIQTLGSR
jgi:tetratricopeptide (TPR) repeat protein